MPLAVDFLHLGAMMNKIREIKLNTGENDAVGIRGKQEIYETFVHITWHTLLQQTLCFQ